jgi:hypothetical protein
VRLSGNRETASSDKPGGDPGEVDNVTQCAAVLIGEFGTELTVAAPHAGWHRAVR